MAGFAPANLRLLAPDAANDLGDIVIDAGDDADQPDINDDGKILRIEHGDGSVTISMNDKPLYGIGHNRGPSGWFDNLAEEIDASLLSGIAEDLLRGVADDEQSRRDWIETVATFITLLGVTIEVPNISGVTDGAPVEGMSRVRHPLLLESVLRMQANARGEFLPTDGPMKIRNDSTGGAEIELMANALEKDMNHYLTAHATEYYPDTDRMFFRLALDGTTFKKVYRCPLRMRPVSETVVAKDLIVSNDATDLANARRVTHKLMMSPTTIRRMQILGAYRDIDLGSPVEPDLDAAERAARRQQGVTDTTINPDDRDRQLYEIYCDLDIPGYEHQWKGKPSGLEIPYRVTIDVTSRQVLSLVRDYDEPQSDKELPRRRDTFVQFMYVPGLGFYGIGLGHILANTTNAITAAWREMLDNGMFANFPGFLIAKAATRQQTSIIRVPPGGGQPVDTLGKPITQSIMPLPYNTTQMPPLMQLVESMATTGARIGGTAEIQVGEGKQDAPVGTTLALIDQATRIENSVHKRVHAAQALEFKLIIALFREHPEDFLRCEKNSASGTVWDEQTFLAAINDCDLVPQADPNTSSQLQRLMKAMGIKQLQQASQSLYDPIAVDTYALKSMGVNNPQQFFVPPQAMGQPPPQLLQMQAEMKAKQQQADARTTDAQARMHTAQAKLAETQAKIQQGGFGKAGGQTSSPFEVRLQAEDAQTRRMDAETRRQALVAKAREAAMQSQDRHADRQAEANSDRVDLVKALLAHEAGHQDAAMGHAASLQQASLGHAHEARQDAEQHAHEARENAADRSVDLRQAEIDARAAQKDSGSDG
jgi:hypothetical protein